jgi:hypothetical protein
MWYNVPRLDNDTAGVHCILISFVKKEARAVAGFVRSQAVHLLVPRID